MIRQSLLARKKRTAFKKMLKYGLKTYQAFRDWSDLPGSSLPELGGLLGPVLGMKGIGPLFPQSNTSATRKVPSATSHEECDVKEKSD